ncbi:DUF7289 family protein [Natronomonas marina]|uniref:DUF7289 family protein n=1 Tax=Natronomonas marina TaxID=2961939 RepID=UPI0020C9ED6E|nr:type IV pilin [Natronomonas marina]
MKRIENRGQSNVVGVALLLGIAVVSMGALTAAVGVVVDESAAQADAERVANDFDSALEPVAATGPQRGTVTFSQGRLQAADRTLEVRADGGVVERLDVDALVYESGDRRVAFLMGAIVRGERGRGWLETGPPVTVDDDVLVVGAPVLGEDVGAVSGSEGVTATVETDVSHDRRNLGEATFTLAIETTAPGAWARTFEEMGATVDRNPGDPPTVVATFEGDRTGYLVVHRLDTEVSGGD